MGGESWPPPYSLARLRCAACPMHRVSARLYKLSRKSYVNAPGSALGCGGPGGFK